MYGFSFPTFSGNRFVNWNGIKTESMQKNDYTLALVTGGAHRLGKVFALELARQGYAILLHFHESEDAANETAEEIREMGVPVFLLKADFTTPHGIQSITEALDSIEYSLKVLVNSAGVMQKMDFQQTTIDEWDQVINLNLRAPFFIAQLVAGRMSDGVIINITDAGVGRNWTSYSTYLISKSALSAVTGILAKALAPEIRVNAIAPGLVLPHGDFPVSDWEKLVIRTPMKKSVPIKDVASALEFLVKNTSVTGQMIIIDGGYSLV
jgi:NAD(P)-dependent dehydrogenase (short-subunit alcohol dehydrogenase family)